MKVLSSGLQRPKLKTRLHMRMKSLLTVFILLLGTFVFGQNQHWKKVEKEKRGNIEKRIETNAVYPKVLTLIEFEDQALNTFLSSVPNRSSNQEKDLNAILELPMPDGSSLSFFIEEASIMHPKLQSKFPDIKSYAGYGVEDKSAYLRFDRSHKGYHFQVLSAKHGVVKIDPVKGENKTHMVYYKKDLHIKDHQHGFECAFEGKKHGVTSMNESSESSRFLLGDTDLRDYKLAVAATGEYTSYHGGTVEDAIAAINTTITRVVGIYEKEFSITMTLVANNDIVIYTNSMTDPFTNGNASMMISENMTNMNSEIGSSNFDIGHLFGTSGAGLAYLNGPCGSNKAGATSAVANPVGDFFDVDYVCHEMGHQFGANHTQYNACNRNNATSMEPGSGSTIMAYAGICAPNVQSNSDAYFNAASIEEIENFTTTGNGNSCPTKSDFGNLFPSVSAGSNYFVPKSTPFALTASASDPDGDELTYCWEQRDNIGSATQPPVSTNLLGPMFRSLSPSLESTRYFPSLSDVINGNSSEWEVLPSVGRTMNFRVTVRDNAPGNGLTDEDDMIVTVDALSGPFELLIPNTGVEWNTGESQTITWDVANTDLAPVSCGNVDLLLSLDGGFTYPTTLASNVPNDGSHTITVPNLMSSFARIRINCSDNIFYDISDTDFGLNAPVFPDYCIPEYSNSSCSSGDFIDDVVFETINNTESGCALDGDNYSNFKNQKTFVEDNNAYTLSVKCNPNYAQYFAAYVDWNLDGDFLDANEFIDIGHVGSSATETANLVVPSGVLMGEKLLRIVCRYGTSALTANDGCSTSFNYGETEDYLLEVGVPCISNITVLENYGNGSTETVSVSNEITASNIINAGATINYIAGSQIKLNSGFEVEVGATFEAYIGPCQ